MFGISIFRVLHLHFSSKKGRKMIDGCTIRTRSYVVISRIRAKGGWLQKSSQYFYRSLFVLILYIFKKCNKFVYELSVGLGVPV